jgi:hypothetical protein
VGPGIDVRRDICGPKTGMAVSECGSQFAAILISMNRTLTATEPPGCLFYRKEGRHRQLDVDVLACVLKIGDNFVEQLVDLR